jgi:hypothetical protein
MKKFTRQVPHEHERASEAEEVSGEEQQEDQCTAKVNPRQRCGEIFWRQRWTEEPVKNHGRADDEHGNLKQRSRMPPAKQVANQRKAQ